MRNCASDQVVAVMATRAVNLEKGPLVLVGELADQVDAVRERPMALGKPVLPEDLADVAVYHYYPHPGRYGPGLDRRSQPSKKRGRVTDMSISW